jgi:hypothetical protein
MAKMATYTVIATRAGIADDLHKPEVFHIDVDLEDPGSDPLFRVLLEYRRRCDLTPIVILEGRVVPAWLGDDFPHEVTETYYANLKWAGE